MTAIYELIYGQSTNKVSGVGKVRVKESHLWLFDESGAELVVLPLANFNALRRTDIPADKLDEDVMLVFLPYSTWAVNAVIARVSGVTDVEAYNDPGNNNRAVLVLGGDDKDLPAGAAGFQYGIRREGMALS